MDLRQWDFERQGNIELSGEWEFYWEQLLFADSIVNGNDQPKMLGYLTVPGFWNGFKLENEKELPGKGFATLRLRVLLEDQSTQFALKLLDTYSAYRIFVNGLEVANCGIVGTGPGALSYDQNIPQISDSFDIEDSNNPQIEIIIHISNFSMLYGGVAQKIVLGELKQIQKTRELLLSYDFFLVGSIFLMTLYHLILFILRPSNRSTLYFFGTGLFTILFISVIGESILTLVFPAISTDILFRIVIVAELGMVIFFGLFVHSEFPDDYNPLILRSLLLFYGLLLVVTLFAPLAIYPFVHPIYMISGFLYMLYVIFVLLKALNKGDGAEILIFGFAIWLTCAVMDIFYFFGIISIINLLPFGMLAIIFCQSVLLSKRFNETFIRAESLSVDLEEKNQKLLELDKIKDEFLANTSHELRTPLHGMKGVAETLKRKLSKNTPSIDTLEDFDLIISSADRLDDLVDDMLDFTKLKYKDIKLSLGPMDIHSMTEVVFRTLYPMVENKKIQLLNKIPKDFKAIYADERRLWQILLNLVSNAIKNSSTGDISIEAFQKTENMAEISITDEGRGIAEHDIDFIFDPFVQVGQSLRFPGTGIGLSITKNLVELHGGEIKVKSQLNIGTRITFSIPFADTAQLASPIKGNLDLGFPQVYQKDKIGDPLKNAANVTKEKQASENTLSSPLILIVDDDYINRKILSDQLNENYQVEAVSNGFDALRKLEELPIDLILLDIMMGKMNGFEFCKKIRQDSQHKTLPVIMITADKSMESRLKGLKAGDIDEYGCDDFLTKPFNSHELLCRVHNQLKLRENIELKQDIQRIKGVVQELNQSVIKHERMIDVLEDGILFVDHELSISFSNQSAEHILSKLKHELLQQNICEVIADPQLKQTFNRYNELFAHDDKINRYDLTNLELNAESKNSLFVRVIPLMSRHKKLLNFVTVLKTNENRNEQQVSIRESVVKLMKKLVNIYELHLEKEKPELARATGWALHTEKDGRDRSRTFDKYLDINTIPKNPRLNPIYKTARYILSRKEIPQDIKHDIQQELSLLIKTSKL